MPTRGLGQTTVLQVGNGILAESYSQTVGWSVRCECVADRYSITDIIFLCGKVQSTSSLSNSETSSTPASTTLRLRPKKVVQWGEDVVDNELLGRKKSKKCCIFHKRRKFGESSSESEGYSSGCSSGGESEGSTRSSRRKECNCEQPEATEHQAAAAVREPRSQRRPFTQRMEEPGDGGTATGEWMLTGLSAVSKDPAVAAVSKEPDARIDSV